MPKRKREDNEEDYDQFCKGLGKTCSKGIKNNSYVYSSDHRVKRRKINPNFYPVKYGEAPRASYKELHWTDKEFRKIEKLVNNPSIVIESVIQVDNPLLQKAYNTKKEEKLKHFGDVEEALLFHGTKEANVESICKYNFDWRLFGRNVGHKFGKGVNFSVNAKYASSYSSPDSYTKVMIIAKVLIGNKCAGRHDMSVPPPGFDTTEKGRNGIVVVKYDDNEFYPAYILYYHLRDRHHQNDYNHRRNRLSYHSNDNLYHHYQSNDLHIHFQYDYHYGNWRYNKYNNYGGDRYREYERYDNYNNYYGDNYNYYKAKYNFKNYNKSY